MEADIPYLIEAVNDILRVLDRFESTNNGERDLELLVSKLDYLHRITVNLDIDDFVSEMIGRAYTLMSEIERVERSNQSSGYSASAPGDGRRGRPSFQISREQLLFFIEQGFKVKEMSSMLKVSVRTVERRMSSFGLTISGTYSSIDDSQLDEIIMHACNEHPGIGIRMLQGYLRSKGYRVQRERIRFSLLRNDPIGVVQRWRQTVKRCHYSVKSLLSLWHIDGNHKLIRWRIVIHGGVDGYSRIPVFLKASNNNNADTVMALFLEAVHEYGLPSRVRSDKGGENIRVSTYMLSHVQRGPGRGSMITGKSTHNQQIERLWRDVFAGCLCLFYDLFHYLECQDILDPDSDEHLWCLHYVFLPIINRHLTEWRNAWIHHPLSSEKNKSPMQLWIRGLQTVAWSSNSREDEIFQGDGSSYGIDWCGPIPEDASETEQVEVPHTPCPFTQDHVNVFPRTDDMSYSDGIETFQQIINLTRTIM